MIIRPAQPIATQNKVSSDRRAIFVSLSNESGEVDLLLAQRNQRFGQLRTIYIDTSAQDDTGNGCVIETDIGQNITVLANTQGYYTVFVPFVSKLKISSNETATVLLLDFDVSPNFWDTKKKTSSVSAWSYVASPGNVISNTTARSNLFTLDVPANTLGDSSAIELFVGGNILSGTGSAGTFTWIFNAVGIFGNDLGSVSAAYASVVSPPHAFNFNLRITKSPFSDSAIFVNGIYNVSRARNLTIGQGNGDLSVVLTATQGVVAPFNGSLGYILTDDSTFALDVQMSAASPNMSVEVDSIIAKQVN